MYVAEDLLVISILDETNRAAVRPVAERHRPPAHVEHRKHAEPDVVLPEPRRALRLEGLEDVAPVREKGTLRIARRAARVEHDVRIVLAELTLRLRLCVRRPRQEIRNTPRTVEGEPVAQRGHRIA